MPKHNSYHTSLKILAKQNRLPQHYTANINRSTIWRWKQEPDDKYTGIELSNLDILEEFISRQETQALMKSYLKLAFTVGLIFVSSQVIMENLQSNKELFVNTILNFKHHINTTLVLRLLKIPVSIFHYWKNKVLYKCESSPVKLCKHKYPQQLTSYEVSTLKELALDEQFKFWSTSSLAWYARRENRLHISLATWYKYIRKLGIKLPRRPKKKRHPKGTTATAPNQIWHADITVVKRLDGLKNYVYLLMDNYSKYIINWRVEPVVSGQIRMQTIKDGYENYLSSNKNIQLIIDGGPENNNIEMDDYLSCDGINIQKLIGLKDIPQSNSLIEAQNRLLKYQMSKH